MHFSSYNNFGSSHDAFKIPCTSADQQQQQQNPIDTSADFFSFADASSDFNHVDPASIGTAHYDSHAQTLEAAYHMLPFHAVNDPLGNHTPMLAGHNPDYLISPMLQSTSHADMTTTGMVNDEEAIYPLVLPANNSPFPHQQHSRGNTGNTAAAMSDEHLISPLTSPAMHSVSTSQHNHKSVLTQAQDASKNEDSDAVKNHISEDDLQRKLALIEHRQQQLRNAHRYLHNHQQLPPSPSTQPVSSDINSAAHSSSNIQSSPYLDTAVVSSSQSLLPQRQSGSSSSSSVPATATTVAAITTTAASGTSVKAPAATADDRFIAPATPSLLMKLGQHSAGTPTNSAIYTNNMASAASSSAVDNMGSLPAAMLEIKPPTATKKITPVKSKRRRMSRASGAFTSPGLVPMISPHFSSSDPTLPVLLSPAALRPQLVTSSPRALKPLISPSLKPNGKRLNAYEEEAAAAALASKSNYQNMREGKAKSLGIDFSSTFQSGVETRRSAHKVAEQRRRDTLKQSFDSLRKEIADAVFPDEEYEGGSSSSNNGDQPTGTAEVMPAGQERRGSKEKEVKQMSKVELIQHSYEYILKLKEANKRKDHEMKRLRQQIDALNQQLKGNNNESSNDDISGT
ncbi:hypothetical protein BX666DRAFT_2002041 [Dichotomocladium elegans]|nr:hypothetical protein BX666DRAFT_2002041 [Dichotomocladium elegans]